MGLQVRTSASPLAHLASYGSPCRRQEGQPARLLTDIKANPNALRPVVPVVLRDGTTLSMLRAQSSPGVQGGGRKIRILQIFFLGAREDLVINPAAHLNVALPGWSVTLRVRCDPVRDSPGRARAAVAPPDGGAAGIIQNRACDLVSAKVRPRKADESAKA